MTPAERKHIKRFPLRRVLEWRRWDDRRFLPRPIAVLECGHALEHERQEIYPERKHCTLCPEGIG